MPLLGRGPRMLRVRASGFRLPGGARQGPDGRKREVGRPGAGASWPWPSISSPGVGCPRRGPWPARDAADLMPPGALPEGRPSLISERGRGGWDRKEQVPTRPHAGPRRLRFL